MGEYTCIRRLVKKIKTEVPPKASSPISFIAGESAQVDFGQGPEIVDVNTGETIKTWFFVMVLSWSRHQYAELVPNQKVETWLGCHKRAFEFFGGVPKKIIIDNAKCAITRACYHDPEINRSYAHCAEAYGFLISPCPPREPQKKGRVESGVKYVKKNFMPLRHFRCLKEANEQLIKWVLEIAGNRKHGSTYEKPLNRFTEIEKDLLKSLPPRPYEWAVWKSVTVHGDCHVQYEKCRYSVPYQQVKQTLWLKAPESSISVYKDFELVAIHPRLWKEGQRHTVDAHLPPDAVAYAMQDPQWCLKQAKEIGPYCHQVIEHLFQDKVCERLRAAQGNIGLARTYKNKRLEAACQRAIAFNTLTYSSVKTILKRSLEYEPLPVEEAFDNLSSVYKGAGLYCRASKHTIQ
jgi:hypothetical protein